jgi:hypothetical protein
MRGRRDSPGADEDEAKMKGERLPVGRAVPERAAGASAMPPDFPAALFGRAAPEDLARYSAQEIAALAALTFEHLQHRVPG